MLPQLIAKIAAAALVAVLAVPAFAVSPVGGAIRIDVDPNTSFYGFGNYIVARTGNGGFAVEWEEDTNDNGGGLYEAVRFRVFKPNRKPVAAPGAVNFAGLAQPSAVAIVPLGKNKAFAAFSGFKSGVEEKAASGYRAYGHALSLSNGAASARKLLATTDDNIAARIASLSNGKAIFAAFGFNDPADYSDIPGRLISSAGKPGAANLQLALDEDSQLVSLQTLGTGFLGYYAHVSLFTDTFETFGRVFKADGSPRGPAKTLPKAPDLFHLTSANSLSNNRVLVRRFEKSGARHRLTGQIFDDKWKSVVSKKVLIEQSGGYPVAGAYPLLDGGFLLWQRTGSGSNAKHKITRFNAQLAKVGKTYTFDAIEGDIGRAVALNAGNWIAVYKKQVGGRTRLVAQLLKN